MDIQAAVDGRDPGHDGCAACRRPLAGRAGYTLGGERRCLGCALCYAPMVRRSAATGLVVGTILVAINQGGAILAGEFRSALLWQIPLTYAVPFFVATWGALGSSRTQERGR